MIWLLPRPLPSSRQQVFSLSQSSCVPPVELTSGRGVGEEKKHTTARKLSPLKIIQYSLAIRGHHEKITSSIVLCFDNPNSLTASIMEWNFLCLCCIEAIRKTCFSSITVSFFLWATWHLFFYIKP
jgi:hypothetical protein